MRKPRSRCMRCKLYSRKIDMVEVFSRGKLPKYVHNSFNKNYCDFSYNQLIARQK